MTNHAKAFFEAHAVGPVPFPPGIAEAMLPCGPDCLESVGFETRRQIGASIREVASRWLDTGSSQVGARCEFTGSGVRSNQFQLVLESPRCGLFLAKRASSAMDDGPFHQRRIEGALALMRRVVDAAEAARTWPASKRLALVDDDAEGLIYWGWVDGERARWDDLDPDDTGWIAALLSIEAMNGPSPRP